MYVEINKKHLTAWVEHSNYMIVLGAILIGFACARSIVDPDFITTTNPSSVSILAQKTKNTHGSATLPNAPQIDQLPANYFVESVELDDTNLLPHVFLKLQNSPTGYLLHVGTNNFVVHTTHFQKKLVNGEGHFVLRVNGRQKVEFFSSPIHLHPERLTPGTNVLQVFLVDNMGKALSHDGNLISETFTFTY